MTSWDHFSYYIYPEEQQFKKEFLFALLQYTQFNQPIENITNSNKFKLTLSLTAQELQDLICFLQSDPQFAKYFQQDITQ